MDFSAEPGVVAEIRDRLRSDLTTAMKTGDQIRVRVLRSALTSIENAAAVPAEGSVEGTVGYADVPRLTLDRARVVQVLEAEVREREEGAVTYDSVGRHEEAATLRSEAELLLGYLAEL